MSLRLCQVIVPVPDIERAREFYAQLLETEGRQIAPGRHSFDCGGTTVTCFDAAAEGGEAHPRSSGLQTILYLAVEDLDEIPERIQTAGGGLVDQTIVSQPWGTRSFRGKDPFGNPLGFVDEVSLQRQLQETSQGGPEDRLRVGQVLTLQRTQAKTGKAATASIAKIFPDEIWLALVSKEAQPFSENESVQIQFIEEGMLFYADTEVLKVAASARRFGAIAIPQTIKTLQRRAAPRVSMERPLEVTVVGAAGDIEPGTVIRTTTRNVSTGGARFETELPLQAGDELKLNLSVSASHQLQMDAKTVSVNPVEGNAKSLNTVGVQFLGLKLDDQVKILQLLMGTQAESASQAPAQKPPPRAPAAAEESAPAPAKQAPLEPQKPAEPEPTKESEAEDDIPLF